MRCRSSRGGSGGCVTTSLLVAGIGAPITVPRCAGTSAQVAPEPVPRSPESVPKCVGTAAQVASESVPRWRRNERPGAGGIRTAVGRAVIWRIYDDDGESQWHETVLSLAGFDDAGLEMIRLALARPQTAVHIWWRIFETRGLRGGPTRAGWAWWNPKRRNRERDAVFATLVRRDAH